MKKLLFLVLIAVIAFEPGDDAHAKGMANYLKDKGIITEDYYPNISIRGRMHLDAGWYDEDNVEFGDGFNARRVRMGMSGRLDPNWSFNIEYDFAEEGTSANDVLLSRKIGDGILKIGQNKVPMGLNELTSSNNITFIERASNSNIIADSRRIGLGYDYHGNLYGLQSMIFGRAMGDDRGSGRDMPMGIAARVYGNPVSTNDTRVHVGLSAAYEDRRDFDTLRFRDRPEARADSAIRLIDTGNIANIDTTFKAGVELAFQRGPFSMEAEYLMVDIDNGDQDPTFDGYHVQAGYVLTGESRSYRNGVFRGITPRNKATGAWEAAIRWSSVDLSDSGIEGGKQENLTLGLNYYATSNVRFMANCIFVDVTDSLDLESGIGDDSPNIYLLRAQYSF